MLVAVAALPSSLGFKDPRWLGILPGTRRGRKRREDGAAHPVPFRGEWPQIAERKGRNALYVLSRAV